MFHRIRSTHGRTLAAIATAALLGGTAATSAAFATPATRAEARSTQTIYLYYSTAAKTTVVGMATAGCGDPYVLQWGVVTSYVTEKQAQCPQ